MWQQLTAKVKDVMSSPAITLSAEKTVSGTFHSKTLEACWLSKISQSINFDFMLTVNRLIDADAAVLMLKNKVHRIPVVNDQQQVVGEWRQFSQFKI